MIVSITGPSGIGKSTIIAELCKIDGFYMLKWATTRPKRKNENTNNNRVFVTQKRFKKMLDSQEIIFPQELFGNMYGLVFSETEAGEDHKIYVTELHIDNVKKAKDFGMNLFSIALIPSDTDFLRTRLEEYRQTETQEEIKERLTSSTIEISDILKSQNLFRRIITVSLDNQRVINNQIIDVILQETRKGGS